MCVFDGTCYKITTTNYISKTFLYTTFRMCSLGPWSLKILMFALLVTCEIEHIAREYMLGLLLILISKYWGWGPPPPPAGGGGGWILGVPPPPPPRVRHAFLKQRHMCKKKGYLFLPRFFSMYDAIHGWMTRWMDGWVT